MNIRGSGLSRFHVRGKKEVTEVCVTNFPSGTLKVIFALFVSLKFSLVPHNLFKDRDNYLVRIEHSEAIFFGVFSGETPFIFSEPFFAFLNYFFGLFFDPDFLLSFYVFINTFVMLLFVLFNRRSLAYSFAAMLLLFAIPYFYGSTLGAIRQGLGFNFLMISLMRKNQVTSRSFVFSLFVASLFHVVFYVFLFLVVVYKALRKVTRDERLIYSGVFLAVCVIGGSWRLVTPYLSSSQSYEGFESSTSGLMLLGWGLIFVLFLFNYFYLRRRGVVINEGVYVLSIVMLLCFIVFYWLAPGPSRFLYSCTPFLVCAVMSNFNRYAALSYMALFFYGVFLLSLGAGAGSMTVSFSELLKVLFFDV